MTILESGVRIKGNPKRRGSRKGCWFRSAVVLAALAGLVVAATVSCRPVTPDPATERGLVIERIEEPDRGRATLRVQMSGNRVHKIRVTSDSKCVVDSWWPDCTK